MASGALARTTNILIEVLRGEAVALPWLEGFHRWPVDDAIARESVGHCASLPLAARNSRDFPLELGGVVHPYGL